MEILGTVFLYALILAGACLVFGVIACVMLSVAASRGISIAMRKTKRQILEILPKTDCGQCGYSTCEGYADAAVSGTEKYRTCPCCSDGYNSRMSFLWAKPKEDKDEAKND